MEKDFIIGGTVFSCRSTYDTETDMNGVDVYIDGETFIGELQYKNIPDLEDCEDEQEYQTLVDDFESDILDLMDDYYCCEYDDFEGDILDFMDD